MELTIGSGQAYDKLCLGKMTPRMAAEYLNSGELRLRSFAETLSALYPHSDLRARLASALLAAEPDANPGSVDRRVRNWLGGRSCPQGREELFCIAFGLGLGEAGADRLLGFCTGYGIHYRECRDLVYAWFLRAGRSYAEARAFYEALPLPPGPPDGPERQDGPMTRELQTGFARVQTEQELRGYCIAHQADFGAMHARAYVYFQKYLDQLIHPAPAWGGAGEPDYSVESVMRLYLSLIPSSRSRQGYSVTQKLIKRDWPNATTLKNIRLRKEDVSRKLLLLLYVVTENVLDGEYNELDEEYITPRQRLEDHWWTLDAILADCGMPPLDPRNASDWLVLYALMAEDEPMSGRMEQVIGYLFADGAQPPPEPPAGVR